MTPPPASLRERKKLETRLALARAALRLFEERGYAETTVDDIAAAANVSRRTFFRYFAGKDEVVIVDPAGKLEALHVALAEGPPDEPTIAALRRGILALTEAYFEPDLIRSVARIGLQEPALAAAAMAYQVHWEDELAREVAVDLGVDVARDPRPRIVAHTTVAIMRAAFAAWLQDESLGTPVEAAAVTFDNAVPALQAILAMPVG
jgi:AcrR family transcriptional regulator